MADSNAFAEKTAKRLEKLRRKLLGANSQLILYKDGANGYTVLATVVSRFLVRRRSNLTIGEEYLEARIAEQAGVATKEIMRQIVAVKYLDCVYKASVVEQAIDLQKIFVLRLTPLSQTQ